MGELSPVAKWDVTELSITDDLADPTGMILNTELAYARVYGARHSFLLVNGSTAGLYAMLLSIGKDKRVLLSADCHKAAISGAALAGHDVGIIPVEENGVVTAEAVNSALDASPAAAVLIVSPDYYGRCADIEAIANLTHAHGALLMVDAAHGAHFPFSAGLPYFPARCVDMWCVSAHKTLNSLTQTAVLNLGHGCPLTALDIRRAVNLAETSSPSYLFMTSLDWALHSADGWDKHIERILALREKLSKINGLLLPCREQAGARGIYDADVTRLVVDVSGRGISGKTAAAYLESADIFIEMADAVRIVLITSPNDPDEWYSRLYDALNALPYGADEQAVVPLPPHTGFCMPIRDAMLSDVEYVPLERSAGRICAQPTGVYPPGIAALLPGESISESAIAYLRAQLAAGLSLFGSNGDTLCCVKGKKSI